MTEHPELTSVLQDLLGDLGADRVTLRLEPTASRVLEVGQDMPVIDEVVADGITRIQGGVSLDIREGPSLPYLINTRDYLVVEDCDTSEFAPPPGLRAFYGVDAEMLGPLFDDDDRLIGMVSVHACRGPRRWTVEQRGIMSQATADVARGLGLRAPEDLRS